MTRQDIQMKYLKLTQDATRKLWDEYFQIDIRKMPKKEQYKLVNSYHDKAAKLIKKYNDQGIAELKKLGLENANVCCDENVGK